MTHFHEPHATNKTLRAAMSVAAALCVLGLASLVFVHAPDVALAVDDTSPTATNTAPRSATAPGGGWTSNVPSADSVFRGKGYIAPEEPIAQF